MGWKEVKEFVKKYDRIIGVGLVGIGFLVAAGAIQQKSEIFALCLTMPGILGVGLAALGVIGVRDARNFERDADAIFAIVKQSYAAGRQSTQFDNQSPSDTINQ